MKKEAVLFFALKKSTDFSCELRLIDMLHQLEPYPALLGT